MSKVKGNKIYIESSDELASVIDRVVNHKEDKIFLCISDESYITQNVMNFRLLKREAEGLGKDLTVVSKNKRVQSLASMASLNVEEEPPVSYAGVEDAKEVSAQLAASPIRKRPKKQPISDIVVPTNKDKKEEEEIRKRMLEVDDVEENKPKEKVEVHEYGSHNRKRAPQRTFERLQKKQEEKEEKKKKDNEKKEKFAPSNKASVASFAKRPKNNSKKKKISPKKATIAVLVLAVLAGLAYLGLFILPSATLTLTPYSEQDNMTFLVAADSNTSSVNNEENIIPAQVMEERESDTYEFEATGSADIREHATGVMTVHNETSNSQTLVQTTRFVSSDGKLFRSTEHVVVPAGGTATVPVRAAEPGEEYNIGPSTFSIPGLQGTPQYNHVYGRTSQDMEGGYVGTRTIVSSDDMERVEEEVENDLLPRVGEALRSMRPDNLTIFEKSFTSEIESMEIGAEPGDVVDSFTVEATALARTFLISEQDLNTLIEHYFINFTDYAEDYELSNQRRINYEIEEMDYEVGIVEFTLSVDQIFSHKVDTGLIAEQIAGQDEDGVIRILADREDLEHSELRLWPFWVRSVPQSVDDIRIELEHVAELDLEVEDEDE